VGIPAPYDAADLDVVAGALTELADPSS
jgi:hypothetical protein